jgi:hypothetical protein
MKRLAHLGLSSGSHGLARVALTLAVGRSEVLKRSILSSRVLVGELDRVERLERGGSRASIGRSGRGGSGGSGRGARFRRRGGHDLAGDESGRGKGGSEEKEGEL